MIEAFRIVTKHLALSAFDGEGARKYGARWNSPGTRMIYTASARSLAILEILAHIEDEATLSSSFCSIRVEFPDELVSSLDTEQLPKGWDSSPALAATPIIGDNWAKAGESPILAVPSAIVPEETNYLLNPDHSDFGKITIDEPIPIGIDPRLTRFS